MNLGQRRDKMADTISLSSDSIKGLDSLAIDDTVKLILEVKVTSLAKDKMADENEDEQVRTSFEVLGGEIEDVMDKIDSADSISELDKAIKGSDYNGRNSKKEDRA